MTQQTLNIHSRSKHEDATLREIARMLSPLRNRPFKFEGIWFASFEGFFAGIKYPEGSEARFEAFASSLGYAQQLGGQADTKLAFWARRKVALGSQEHISIVKAAHWASIMGNQDRKQALLATEGLFLTHEVETGADPHYSPEQFCADLMELREKLLAQ